MVKPSKGHAVRSSTNKKHNKNEHNRTDHLKDDSMAHPRALHASFSKTDNYSN